MGRVVDQQERELGLMERISGKLDAAHRDARVVITRLDLLVQGFDSLMGRMEHVDRRLERVEVRLDRIVARLDPS